MNYTPTEWKNGDIITAEKMNNIEGGITNAMTGKMAIVSVSSSAYGSSSHRFGDIIYATYDGEKWVVTNDDDADWFSIFGNDHPYYRILPPFYIPDSDTLGVFIAPFGSSSSITVTGDISDTSENVYFDYGSLISSNCHRITGNGSIHFTLI